MMTTHDVVHCLDFSANLGYIDGILGEIYAKPAFRRVFLCQTPENVEKPEYKNGNGSLRVITTRLVEAGIIGAVVMYGNYMLMRQDINFLKTSIDQHLTNPKLHENLREDILKGDIQTPCRLIRGCLNQ